VLFLLEWLGGDTLNLAGCILTNQLPTQTYTAMLFVSMDVVMVTQYAYLTYWTPKKKKNKAASEDSALLADAHNDLTAPATDFSPLAGRGNGTPERPKRLEQSPAVLAFPAVPEGGAASARSGSGSRGSSGASNSGMPIRGSHASSGSSRAGHSSGAGSLSGGRSLEYEAPEAARSATNGSARSAASSGSRGGGVSAGVTASIAAVGMLAIVAVGMVAPLPTLTKPGSGPIPSVIDSVYPGAWAHAGPMLEAPMAAVSALGDAVGWSGLYAPLDTPHEAVQGGVLQPRALRGVNATMLATVPVLGLGAGGRRLDLAPCKSNKTMGPAAKTTGIVLGYISSVLYLNSRLPQIIKNFRRKSVAGLSWLMFVCAFMGNLTTVTAIFMRATSKADYESEAPFLPGNAGTLLFDLTIVIQYALYTRRAQARRRRRAAWKTALGDDAPASDEEEFSEDDDMSGGEEGGERHPPRHGPGATGGPARSRDEENLSLLLQNTPRLPSNAPRGVHDIVEDVDAQYLHAPLPTPPMPPRGGNSQSIREAARDWLAAVTQRRGSQ